MAEHELSNDIFGSGNGQRFWPLDEGVSCPGCPDCDQAIAHFLHGLESELRYLSVDLWLAGWTPDDLLIEVRRAAGRVEATSLLAHLLLVDDAQRSEQARPPAWQTEVEALRSRTGVTDVAAGWLTGWLVAQPSARQASECLKSVAEVLHTLAHPAVAWRDAG